MGDKFSLGVGLAHDLELAFRRTGWGDPEEVKRLASGNTLRLVHEVVLGRAEIRPLAAGDAKPNLRCDKRQDGWTLLEHQPRRIVSVADLELVSFLRSGERSIKGYDLIGRARYEFDANLGQEDAEFLLEHEEEIPVEFRQYYLVFTGTIRRRPDGGLYVSFLAFVGKRWNLYWRWLGGDYGSDGRLLCPRK